MFEYVSKFVIGGLILVLATYFSKSKNLFLAGLITTMPLLTLANLTVQLKSLDLGEFQRAQKNGIFGALGLALFILGCYLFSNWMRPGYAVLAALGVYSAYIVAYKVMA